MAGLPARTLTRDIREFILENGLCNFVLFKRNVDKGIEQARALCQDIKDLCQEAGLPFPVIATDQEGGTVQRLAPPHWPSIPGNMQVAKAMDPLKAVDEQVDEVVQSLKSIGVSLNLAPVLDVGPANTGVLKGRTYGQDPRMVSYLGLAYIRKLQFMGIGATAKHFPGIGRVEQDPHVKRPVIHADARTIFRELMPFEYAIEMSVQAIMTSHVIYTDLDPDNPATFSRAIVTDLLRGKMAYKGVAMTDDLEMGGITAYGETGEASVRALEAGHDLLLICNDPERVTEAVDSIHKAVMQGRLATQEIELHLNRVERMRNHLASTNH